MTLTQFQEQPEDILVLNEVKSLILHNDEINTFDWVIESLIEICRHDAEQAFQCTLLIHYKGKAEVKIGSYEILLPMKDAFIERGIQATID